MKSSHISKSFYRKLGTKKLGELAKEWKVNDDVRIVKKLINKKDKILDIGCGYGRVAIPLAKAGFDVTGIDISANLIQEARKRARKSKVSAKFDVGNMVKLPYKNVSFSKIVSLWNTFNELLTIREQIKALNEMFRVLRLGGMVFIVVKDGENKKIRAELKEKGTGPEHRLLKSELKGIKSISYIHDKSTLKSIIKKSKFKKGNVRFKRMNARRRLIVYLYK